MHRSMCDVNVTTVYPTRQPVLCHAVDRPVMLDKITIEIDNIGKANMAVPCPEQI